MLRFALADLTGAEVASLDGRLPGAQVNPLLNDLRTASLTLSFDDSAVDEVIPLYRLMKVWLDGELICQDPLLKPRFDFVNRTVEVASISPGYRLQAAYINNRSDTDFTANNNAGVGVILGYTEIDQMEILAQLMEHALPTQDELDLGIPTHGIIRGSLPASIPRTLPYDTGKEIFQAFKEMSELDGGPDFDFSPITDLAYDGNIAKLDGWYPRRGADRSDDVVFEVGLGQDNATALSWEPDGSMVANRDSVQGQTIEGQPPNIYRANSIESQQTYGIYQTFEARTDLVYSDSLREVARAGVAETAFAPDIFEVTPAMDDGTGKVRDPDTGQIKALPGSYGVPPLCGPDVGGKHAYWLGDTVGVRSRVRLGRDTFESSARVYDIALTEDADGSVLTEIKLAPTIDTSSVI